MPRSERAQWGGEGGFKLHLIINECGEVLSCTLTTANSDDRAPVKNLFGKLFGDKGYVSEKLTEELKEMGVELITQIKKNMKQKAHKLIDQILLRKRSIIETVNDQLKISLKSNIHDIAQYQTFLPTFSRVLLLICFKKKNLKLSSTARNNLKI